MRSRIYALAAAFVLAPLPVLAVVVSINVTAAPNCTYSNGALQAIASGGVGPYTFLWGGGETTPALVSVPAGNYSVTVTDNLGAQASANLTLAAVPYAVQDYLSNSGLTEARCGGYEAMVFYPDFSPEVVGPPPYSVNGFEMQYMTEGFSNPMYVHFYQEAGGGYWNTLTFTDGNGCTGTISGSVGWPIDWPSLSVLDVQGSCAGANSGSITFQTGLEGHGQFTQLRIKDSNHYDVAGAYFVGGTQLATSTQAGLAPGDYWLVQWLTSTSWLPSSGCGDSVMVTVPDLGNTCGNLQGRAFMDYNLNCTRQTNEPYVPGSVMEILPGPFYAITDASGFYSTNLPLGSYTVEQQSSTLAEHCTGSPTPFTLTAGAGLATVNMPDSSVVPLDAMITAANSPARPGFQFHIALEVANLTPTASGSTTVTFNFDPTMSFVSASPAGSVVGNTITWNQSQLTAFQERTVHAYLQVPPDINLLGTVLSNSATLTTVNTDASTSNNSVILPVIITGAYDPNDKLATTSSGYSSSQFYMDGDEWIDYAIRFQNTGTDTAFNVVITDTIAPQLDLGSFIAGAASHGYTVDIRNGNTLRFAFYNIQLPDSNVNELRSHGFVNFRIRPSLPLLPGTVIENTANIYFDYNPPVITEPSVLVAEFSTGLEEQAYEQFNLYPNPASDLLRISDPLLNARLRTWQVITSEGRAVREGKGPFPASGIDIQGLGSGAYVLRLWTTDQQLNERFIKLERP